MAAQHAVFVHGMWCQPWVWADWVTRFERDGYDCHCVTLPGHETGAADAALRGITLNDYVAAVELALSSRPDAVVIGHSLGGLICQQVAARRLVAAAVLVNSATPAPVFPLRPVSLPGLTRSFCRWDLWRQPFRLTRREADYLIFNRIDPALAARYYDRACAESGRVMYQVGFGALNLARSNRVDKHAIRCPMLALSGAHDRIIPIGVSRAMARWYGPERIEYREYTDHGHWMVGEWGWDERVSEVLSWLASKKRR